MSDETSSAEALADLAAERAVLGAVLVDDDHRHGAYVRAARIVRVQRRERWGFVEYDGDFADPRHNVIFACMGVVLERHHRIDPVTLADELRQARGEGRPGLLNTVGGVQYLNELIYEVSTCAHVESHAEIVARHADARRLHAAAETVTRMLAQQGPAAYADALALLANARSGGVKVATRTLEAVVDSAWEQVIAGLEGRRKPVPTGFRGLDGDSTHDGLLAGGLHRGELIVVAADQAGGKTSWALQVLRTAAQAGLSGLMFSHEMSAEELSWRMLCGASGISTSKVRSAKLSSDDIKVLQKAAGEFMKLRIRVCDAGCSVEAMRVAALACQVEQPVHLIVVDYLQILDAPEGVAEGHHAEQIDQNARALKLLAREMDCPVVVLSQFNRAGQLAARKPRLQDLKGSGGIESHADVVIVLHPADGRSDGPAPPTLPIDIVVLKQRAGATGEVRVTFERTFTRFIEAEEGGGEEEAYDMPTALPDGYDEEQLVALTSRPPLGEA